MHVRTRIALGKTRKNHNQSGAIIKEDDMKLAYVILPKDQSFVFPKLFQDVKSDVDDKSINEAQKDLKDFLETSKAPGMPAWFRI
ncbi:39S ribosomal protein L23, mitochondrial [Harpegnathos saltator]|uniref:39S ribosomal protein L23, mitochondrial n=2 Tax=Harpegnathos saltator TaxID=610380 RepID=E2B7T1_HARSA|nr:39S ribosomal protein L23, mitochondrial [Harpegnathos saltator]